MRAIIGLLLALIPLALPSRVRAQCGTDIIAGYTPPSTLGYDLVRVVGQGFPPELSGAVSDAMGLWNRSACNEGGSSFPRFQSSLQGAQFTIVVTWNPGPDPEGAYGRFNLSTRQITIFGRTVVGGAEVNSLGHNPEAIAQAVAHELGHFLGLANAPSYCWAGMMMTGFAYDYSTGSFTSKLPSETECSTADSNNTTASESPPGGGVGSTNQTRPSSPIVIDLDAKGFRFSGLDDPVRFDIDADGVAETISWTARSAADAFLVLDRDGNGRIDNGSELFGDSTDQPASEEPNGFLALAELDREEHGGDGDGMISDADAVFAALRLWLDANHDGLSQSSELISLGAKGIRAIELDYVESRRRDRHGNELRWSGMVHFEEGLRLAAADVIFLRR